MSGQIIPFAGGEATQLPAHIAALFSDADSNMQAKANIDQLSYRGKIWRVVVKGEEHIIQRTNSETGEIEPMGIVSLVILDHNKQRSRAYYPGAYEDGKNAAPTCYSKDGVTPDNSVKEPQSATCATCQWSVKGSKITESGKQSTACSPFKRIAVVPSQRVAQHAPLLLRLAQTSVWDKNNGDNEAKGWYAWDQYLDMLRARGAKHTAAVETRVKFDISVPYPKLLFSASRWLNPEEAAAAKARLTADSVVITTILEGRADMDGVTGQPASSTAPAPAAAPVAAPAAPPAGPSAEEIAAGVAAATAKAEADKKARAKADKKAKADAALKAAQEAAAKAAEDDDEGAGSDDGFGTAAAASAQPAGKPAAAQADDGFGVTATPAAAATPTAATKVVSGTPAGLASLLDGWDA